MANGIEELFPEIESPTTTTGQSPAATETAVETALPPSNEVAELRGQIGQLTNLVGQLASRPAYIPPQQQTPPPGQVDLQKLFEDTTFFTPDDTRQLLQTTTPEKEFNRLGNQIKKEVAQPLLNVIARQNQELQTYAQRQQEYTRRQEENRIAAENNSQFYGSFPELKRFERVVQMEALQLENEYNTNPALRHMTPQQAHKMLADRARATLGQYGVNIEAVAADTQPAASPLSANTRRPGFMERGGSSRMPATKPQNDPNKKELAGMSAHLSRGRTRNVA